MAKKDTSPKFKVLYPEAEMRAKVFRLSVVLDLDVYKAKRTIVVSSKTTFLELHELLQTIFCWGGYHLYDFTIKSGRNIVATLAPSPDYDDDEQYEEEYQDEHNEAYLKYLFEMHKSVNNDPNLSYEDFIKYHEEMMNNYEVNRCEELVDSEHTLDEYFPTYKSIIYTYDMGDNWEHKIEFKKEIENWDKELPYLVSAEGAAPPDDVGGVPGFIDFLEAMKNKKHPEHKNMKEWAGDWREQIDLDFIRSLLE